MIIDLVIIFIALLVVVSKFFDCFTTVIMSKKVTEKYNNEINPFARWIMKKIGFNFAVWGIFGFIILISVFLAYEVITFENIYFSIGFIAIGVFVSFAQFDVARANYYQVHSFFTRFLLRLYSKKLR